MNTCRRPGLVRCLVFVSCKYSSIAEAGFLKEYKDKMAEHKQELVRAKDAFDRTIAIDNYEMIISIGENFGNLSCCARF